MTPDDAGPEGDRRRRAGGPVRLRAGRRGDRAGPARPARLLRPVRASDERAAQLAPGLAARLTRIGEERVFVLHWPAGRATRRTRSTCPSATSASCSSPRRRSRPAGTSCWRRPGWQPGDVQQVLLAGSFGSYLSPASAIRIGLVPKLPVLRVVERRATWPARARRWRCSRVRERAAGAGAAGGGEVCRALRPRRLQRPLRRPARLPRLSRPADRRLAVIACGALAGHVREIVTRRGWRVELHSLPALLHNRPAQITPMAATMARAALLPRPAGRRRVRRLRHLRRAGRAVRPARAAPAARAALLRRVRRAGPDARAVRRRTGHLRAHRLPACAASAARCWPSSAWTGTRELWPDYFGHYRRLVWLAQQPEPALAAEAEHVAAMFGLPLTSRRDRHVPAGTGTGGPGRCWQWRRQRCRQRRRPPACRCRRPAVIGRGTGLLGGGLASAAPLLASPRYEVFPARQRGRCCQRMGAGRDDGDGDRLPGQRAWTRPSA